MIEDMGTGEERHTFAEDEQTILENLTKLVRNRPRHHHWLQHRQFRYG